MIGDILQPTHLLFILVVALLVLGPKRLPEVGRALGRGLRDFRSALNTDELRDQMLSTTSTDSMTPIEHEPTISTDTPVAPEPPVPSTGTAEANHGSAQAESASSPEPAASTPAQDHIP